MLPLPQPEYFTFTCDLITQISYHQNAPFLPFKSLFPAPPSSPEWAQISSGFPSVSHSFLFLSLTLRITSTSAPLPTRSPCCPSLRLYDFLSETFLAVTTTLSRHQKPFLSPLLPASPKPLAQFTWFLPTFCALDFRRPSSPFASFLYKHVLVTGPVLWLPTCRWSTSPAAVSPSPPPGGLVCTQAFAHHHSLMRVLIQISVLFCLTLVTPALTSEQLLTVSATGVVFSLLLSSVCVHGLFPLGAQEPALSSPPPTVNRLIFTSALLSFLDI